MPLMHSEDLAVQKTALPLFERLSDPRTVEYARPHLDVIACFGRFPHRNEVLGRVSNAEEWPFCTQLGIAARGSAQYSLEKWWLIIREHLKDLKPRNIDQKRRCQHSFWPASTHSPTRA